MLIIGTAFSAKEEKLYIFLQILIAIKTYFLNKYFYVGLKVRLWNEKIKRIPIGPVLINKDLGKNK